MGKHQKNHTSSEANLIVDKIVGNKKSLSRWLALLNATKIIGEQEIKLGTSDQDLDDGIGQQIINYIDSTAPAIEEILI